MLSDIWQIMSIFFPMSAAAASLVSVGELIPSHLTWMPDLSAAASSFFL